MHRNRVWWSLLAVVGAVTLYLSFSALAAYYHYSRLNERAPAEILSWSVKEVAWGAYAPRASYVFDVHGRQVKGSSLLHQQLFRNEEAARQALKELQQRQWLVWYDISNPERSALERSLPLRQIISAVVMVAIFLYFVGLGCYVTFQKKP